MTRSFITLATVAALSVAGSFTSAVHAQTAAATVATDNDSLEEAIEQKWKADPTLKDLELDVEVKDGVATISGIVATNGLKSRAARLAKVTGVTRVDNTITVDATKASQSRAERAANKTAEGVGVAAGHTKKATETAARETEKGVKTAAKETKKAASKTGTTVSDSWITTKVKTKFVGEDALKHSHISVTTQDKIVTLTGTVASEAGRERAIAIVKATDGVVDVVDRLTIAPGGTSN